MSKENDKNIRKLCHDIGKVILESKVKKGLVLVGVLDMLKTDILLNSGMVVLEGNPLKCVCSEHEK